MIKVELKKISHAKNLSEETPAYSAQVWINGRHFCNTSNHGQGGPDDFHPATGKRNAAEFYEEIKKIDAQIAAEFPQIDCTEFGGTGTMSRNLEMVCHELLDQMEIEKKIARDLKNKIMWVDPASKKIWQMPLKKINGTTPDQVIAFIKKKHNVAQTINEMPFADAVRLLSA